VCASARNRLRFNRLYVYFNDCVNGATVMRISVSEAYSHYSTGIYLDSICEYCKSIEVAAIYHMVEPQFLGMLRRILRYMLKYWHLTTLAVVITLVQAFLGATLPLILIRDVVDNVLAGGQSNLLAYYLATGLIIYAVMSVLSFSGRYVQAIVTQRAIADIRESLVQSLQKKFFSFYDNKGMIEETGSHQELMAKDGLYSHLYKTQFRAQ